MVLGFKKSVSQFYFQPYWPINPQVTHWCQAPARKGAAVLFFSPNKGRNSDFELKNTEQGRHKEEKRETSFIPYVSNNSTVS